MCSPDIIQRVHEQIRTGSSRYDRRHLLRAAAGAAGVGALAAVGGMPHAAFAQATPAATPLASPMASPVAAIGIGTITANTIVDMTHVMTPEFPVWPGNDPFAIENLVTVAKDGFFANKLTYWEHTCTHLDAPAHFDADGLTAELLSPQNFVAPLAVIDISARAADDPDTGVTPDDITAWEAANGPLPGGAFVAMYSGWESRLGDPASFINLDADGVQHYPGFTPEAATFLIDERDIVGIGVDTLSQDPGNSVDFGTHIAILSAGRYGIEGLASLGSVPPVGGTIVVGAPKHIHASGGPTRAFTLF
ncbi:MAG: cyclase family protein [Thermomicrobiales bacterium]